MFYRTLSFYLFLFLMAIPLYIFSVFLAFSYIGVLVILGFYKYPFFEFSLKTKMLILFYGVAIGFISVFYSREGCGNSQDLCFDGALFPVVLSVVVHFLISNFEKNNGQ